ncbi:MAG: LCP family protein [Atopobiaceae bacterium]|nr:LCP family protein [Atopobiaceae bacterium]MCH4214774.1 LCP family protein [Atopobiaceae bacterium]MCH4230000.1 LCP family protein [Atopobiaceae bacterium]MCH4276917.1 LCP family protein [Atopobiaceae bacterium]MCI1225998.1 LCP family protein [Atopobiaceae bacterium]
MSRKPERRPNTTYRRSSHASSSASTTTRHASRASRPVSPSSSLSRDTYLVRQTERRRRRRRKHALVAVLTTLAVLAAGAGVAWAYFSKVSSNLGDGVDDSLRAELTSTSDTEPFYMLLLGTDESEERDADSSTDGTYRSDSMLLVRVDPQNMQVTLVSIPRDTMVEMGSHGTQKINAAYAYGGATYAVQMVEQLAGVSISHYAEIDFDQFATIVDDIGGIDVDVPMEIDDEEYTGHLDAGEQTLTGEQALILCRSRHAYDDYGDGDACRSSNQRLVIAAIVEKVLTLDPVSMASTISTLSGSVTTDMSLTDILSLATQMSDLDVENNVYSGAVPTTSEYLNSIWYEVVDTDDWTQMMARVDAGLSPYESADDDPTAGIAGGIDSVKNADGSTGDSTTTGTVEVQNGTSTQGLAATAASTLTSDGYTTTATNATSTSHTKTLVIYSDTDDADKAQAVADALGGTATVEKDDGSYSLFTDVLVVIGSDWSASATTSTTSLAA